MKVFLANRGNIDYDQDPNRKIYGTKSDFFLDVNSEEEASLACRKYIEDNELGGGAYTGGQVFDDNGKAIAYVSYNGRIWKDKEHLLSAQRMYHHIRK